MQWQVVIVSIINLNLITKTTRIITEVYKEDILEVIISMFF